MLTSFMFYGVTYVVTAFTGIGIPSYPEGVAYDGCNG